MEYLPTFNDQLNEDYISHHGIKGMKWGVRRYQNYDGSYTNLGKARLKGSSNSFMDNLANQPRQGSMEQIWNTANRAYQGEQAGKAIGREVARQARKRDISNGHAPGNYDDIVRQYSKQGARAGVMVSRAETAGGYYARHRQKTIDKKAYQNDVNSRADDIDNAFEREYQKAAKATNDRKLNRLNDRIKKANDAVLDNPSKENFRKYDDAVYDYGYHYGKKMGKNMVKKYGNDATNVFLDRMNREGTYKSKNYDPDILNKRDAVERFADTMGRQEVTYNH